MLKRVAIFALTLASAVFAADAAALSDGIDRNDPNFIKASLVIASPGEELFSCVGHACLRMECPTFKLDNCFTYESEDVKSRVLTFFTGRLRMGMFSVPTPQMLDLYKEDGRGVRQYELNLPAAVKRRLWKVLDDKVAQGVELPYDYVQRGCALAMLHCLLEALGDVELQVPSWPEKFELTRREIMADALESHPWMRIFLQTFIGADLDWVSDKKEKILLPSDLLEFLRSSKVAGQTIVSGEGKPLAPVSKRQLAEKPWLTPCGVAIFLVLVALANAFYLQKRWLDLPFFLLQLLIGVFVAYLMLASSLPATRWNWLIVPFNPLPFLFWRWRKYWALPFALILLGWETWMLLSPHQLTDPAYQVIVLGYVVLYLKIAFAEEILQVFVNRRLSR